MVSCAVRTCSSRKQVDKKESTGITFHRFPKDPERRNWWINMVNRKNWQPTKSSVLCSKHFNEAFIDRTSTSCVRLRENAVPTIDSEVKSTNGPISNILMSPSTPISKVPHCMERGSYSTSITTAIPTFQSMDTTRKHKHIIPISASQPMNSIRKRKVLQNLKNSFELSQKRRKKRLISVEQKLFRHKERIAVIKKLIASFQKTKCIENQSITGASKIPKKKHFSEVDQNMVLDVFEGLCSRQITKSEAIKQTMVLTKTSRSTVYRIIRSGPKTRKQRNDTGRFLKIPEYLLEPISDTIYSMFACNNVMPNLGNVLTELKNKQIIDDCSKTTLWRFLKRHGLNINK